MKNLTRLGAALIALTATPALAHHPLGGAAMETFSHGLLSGIGHPILGFDHLFFVAIVGIAAVFTGRALTAPLGFLAGMVGGVFLCVSGVALPMVEVVIALSLLLVGGIVLMGRALPFAQAMALFAGLGLFHGWAFGEALAGQESFNTAVLAGYLLGLAATQWLIAVGAGYAVSKLWKATEASAIQPRLAGAFVAGIGGFLTLEAAEGAVFSALGLG
ncbi:HupE/UreJ family protein [Rhodobacteraceae bacterium NNCM2]|nr:HupE/UreJ family protein [Coraliihabitans acroporae]